jgi:hypothetical protein
MGTPDSAQSVSGAPPNRAAQWQIHARLAGAPDIVHNAVSRAHQIVS